MNNTGQDLTGKAIELLCPDGKLYGRAIGGPGCLPDEEGTRMLVRLDTGNVVGLTSELVKGLCQELELEQAIVETWGMRCTACTGQGETYTRKPNEFGGTNHIIAPCARCKGTGLESQVTEGE